MNYLLLKVIEIRGHFPNDEAVVKLLWLAKCNIMDERARERAKKEEPASGALRASVAAKLMIGNVTMNWKQALAQLSLTCPERVNPHL